MLFTLNLLCSHKTTLLIRNKDKRQIYSYNLRTVLKNKCLGIGLYYVI